MSEGANDPPDAEGGEVVELPIDGVLDLHTFAPRDLKELLPAYFDACLERGIVEVRVIPGKGTGQLRASVESILRRLPTVRAFRLGRPEEGGWGATLVELQPRP